MVSCGRILAMYPFHDILGVASLRLMKLVTLPVVLQLRCGAEQVTAPGGAASLAYGDPDQESCLGACAAHHTSTMRDISGYLPDFGQRMAEYITHPPGAMDSSW